MHENASLVFRNEHEIKYTLLLPNEEVRVGRDPANDIRLALFPIQDVVCQMANADISRNHCIIRRRADGYTIQDLGSTNGTSVDCIAVLKKERWLQDGHLIDIGGVLEMRVALRGNSMLLRRISNAPHESYLLFSNKITIGSDPDDSICLDNSCLLPRHAEISYQANTRQYSIRLGEEHAGMKIDNIPAKFGQEYNLQNEICISLGDIDLLFKR